MTAWRVERTSGSAEALHARTLPDLVERAVWVLEATGPAVVLGSAQSAEGIAAPVGVDLARRRSGGGAVWVEPGGTLWVDVLVPRDDPLWDDDVSHAAHWLGATWAEALRAVGVEDPVVHRGAMVRTPCSDAICFSGLGPGEVTRGEGGPKLVGISQRRTRAGARFQCVAYAEWAPEPLASLVGAPVAEVANAGSGVGSRALAPLLTALVLALPT